MDEEFLKANPDLVEMAKTYARDQYRKYKEEQRKLKSGEASSVQAKPVPQSDETKQKEQKEKV